VQFDRRVCGWHPTMAPLHRRWWLGTNQCNWDRWADIQDRSCLLSPACASSKDVACLSQYTRIRLEKESAHHVTKWIIVERPVITMKPHPPPTHATAVLSHRKARISTRRYTQSYRPSSKSSQYLENYSEVHTSYLSQIYWVENHHPFEEGLYRTTPLP